MEGRNLSRRLLLGLLPGLNRVLKKSCDFIYVQWLQAPTFGIAGCWRQRPARDLVQLALAGIGRQMYFILIFTIRQCWICWPGEPEGHFLGLLLLHEIL